MCGKRWSLSAFLVLVALVCQGEPTSCDEVADCCSQSAIQLGMNQCCNSQLNDGSGGGGLGCYQFFGPWSTVAHCKSTCVRSHPKIPTPVCISANAERVLVWRFCVLRCSLDT